MTNDTKRKKVTKTQANKVLAAVRKQLAGSILPGDAGPIVNMTFDWTGYGPNPAIVWEEGPYQWTYMFPYGGIEEEFGFKIADVSSQLPAGVWCEAVTAWAMNIYPKDAL